MKKIIAFALLIMLVASGCATPGMSTPPGKRWILSLTFKCFSGMLNSPMPPTGWSSLT